MLFQNRRLYIHIIHTYIYIYIYTYIQGVDFYLRRIAKQHKLLYLMSFRRHNLLSVIVRVKVRVLVCDHEITHKLCNFPRQVFSIFLSTEI